MSDGAKSEKAIRDEMARQSKVGSMRMSVGFEFELFQQVRILPLSCDGFIEQLLVSEKGKQYQVSYWFNGDRKTAWCFSRELEAKTI
jgi:hypothetical protein